MTEGPVSQPTIAARALPLHEYAAIGDGRSVALIGREGAVAWWCVPNLDSHPFFDSLLDAKAGSSFVLQPTTEFTALQKYRQDSNVLETTFTTESGVLRVTDSMNSSLAGRLPWCELARRIEVLSGTVSIRFTCGTRGDTVSPWLETISNLAIIHVGQVLCVLRKSPNINIVEEGDCGVVGEAILHEGDHALIAIVAGENQPLGIPSWEDIDTRIDLSHQAWSTWAEGIQYDGPHQELVRRSALILKLLLFSPSGAIAASATTSLPERIGGTKNYDYRYAWVRDASYIIHAFSWLGQKPESQAALAWLLEQLGKSGAQVCFCLDGRPVPDVKPNDLPGYRESSPVVTGNRAGRQHQHGVYGDIFEAVAQFVESGNVLDHKSAMTLISLADQCADRWHEMDSGMWELEEKQHYTMSKISAWQALNRAAQLAGGGHLPAKWIPRWSRERDRIARWIDQHCWSETERAYTFYPGTRRLDSSLILAVHFGFPNVDRLSSTLKAITNKLSHGPWIYRYSGAEKEEGAFVACTFWLVEAYATLNRKEEAILLLEEALRHLPTSGGLMAEMIDVKSNEFLGNIPQGLSHLALVHAILAIYTNR
jgi:GH15 family glucan-1,4-alpha-glucosidase